MAMKYYIVVNEWKYPTSSGRVILGDYDDAQEAEYHAKEECELEFDTFQEICGDYYRDGSGRLVDAYGNCEGYVLNSSRYEEENMFFRSSIITREI